MGVMDVIRQRQLNIFEEQIKLTQEYPILVVDHDPETRANYYDIFHKRDYSVILAEDGEEAINIVRRQNVSLILAELQLPKVDGWAFLKIVKSISPEIKVIFITRYVTIEEAADIMSQGAFYLLKKPVDKVLLLSKGLEALKSATTILKGWGTKTRENTEDVIETSSAIRETMNMVTQIADSSTAVLITGESGVGKEFIAQTIHDQSPRKNKPFVKVNCAELPETLLEAELFGCDRSITIRDFACRETGCLEHAYGGTLFLDGVDAISPLIQVKLLRVLENCEFERLGGAKTIRSDARLITATNISLKEEVKIKRFREDLYYRLNVINIHIPPLRDRKEDLRYLVQHFVQMYGKRNDKTIKGISKEVGDLFLRYNWPGNVQELENIIERAVVLTHNDYIALEDIPKEIVSVVEGINSVSAENKILHIPIGKLPLKEIERMIIEETLKQNNGDKLISAKLLGISSRTLYRRMDEEENIIVSE